MNVPNHRGSPLGIYSDAARRVFDAMVLHHQMLPAAEIFAGRWMAFRLIDGASNLTAYDSFADAVRAHRALMVPYAYPKLVFGTSLPECESLVKMWRLAYDNGYRPDVDTPLDLILPMGREHL